MSITTTPPAPFVIVTTPDTTVGALVAARPALARFFEGLGIDYCCGGNKSLEEACHTVNLPMDEVLDSLKMAEQSARAVQKDRNSPRSCWLI